jgi:hypothetical protein
VLSYSENRETECASLTLPGLAIFITPFLKVEVCTCSGLGPTRPTDNVRVRSGFGPGSNDSNQTSSRTFRAFSGHSFFAKKRLVDLKMEECSSEMLVTTYKSTWCYGPVVQHGRMNFNLTHRLQQGESEYALGTCRPGRNKAGGD